MTAILRVYDPAMCCSSGVCGSSVDPALVRFGADLDWLRRGGVTVERFNLSQQPRAFVDEPLAKATLEERGEAGLPLVVIDGEIKSAGRYPSRDELAAWAGIATAASEAPAIEGCGCDCGSETAAGPGTRTPLKICC
jgi:Arsenical resistance operon protein ArsD